jgi:hypothetical protein
MRGKSRSASMFDGHVRLESTGVSDVAERENVLRSMNTEIAEGVSNLRSVGRSKVHAGRIGLGFSKLVKSFSSTKVAIVCNRLQSFATGSCPYQISLKKPC